MRSARSSRFQSHVTAAPKKMIRIMQPPRRGLILERYDDLSRSQLVPAINASEAIAVEVIHDRNHRQRHLRGEL